MPGWFGYKAIMDNNKMETENYYRLPPDACPKCGQPLTIGWITQPGGGKEMQRHCDMGHYTYVGGQREI